MLRGIAAGGNGLDALTTNDLQGLFARCFNDPSGQNQPGQQPAAPQPPAPQPVRAATPPIRAPTPVRAATPPAQVPVARPVYERRPFVANPLIPPVIPGGMPYVVPTRVHPLQVETVTDDSTTASTASSMSQSQNH
ncbi:hypothetical protein SEMRO_888_G216420.1 [Seminavis robusta]|uniref:Uncharacterized protein n=1 Tax=Seminavis robusta TaxID=568900 RepID=A0A9N8EET3_9STRA|nr:hypothetical protein SEMRO_888_G216420.1 [Seminavis robusta]|eukprot:Sro888_g216420.1 n/a (136) ;mRNA; f:17314-17721